MRYTFFRTAAIIFFLSACIVNVGAQPRIISYKIKPVPQHDRTNLEIRLNFQPENADSLVVKMPVDCFGMPDLYKYVMRFEGENGTIVEEGEKPGEKNVVPNEDGKVALRYTLSFDPGAMDKFPYSPNTGADYFHVAGCQFLLAFGEAKQKRAFQIEIDAAPVGWNIYSTKSANARRFEVYASREELAAAAIGGGRMAHFFQTKKGKVAVFIHGDFEISPKKIFASVERIVRSQRRWFDDFAQPFYTIVVAPRAGVTAGYAPENAFICFIDRKTGIADLNLLVAHEFFHNWLPNKIMIVQDRRFADFRYEWFSEGFTEYFARRILHEAGLLSEPELAESINQLIYNIADNPHRAKTYYELIALAESGKFDAAAKKLAYYRGALIALNWDAKLKSAGGKRDLSDFLRSLYKAASANGGKIAERDFFEFARLYGIDAAADLERYIMRGEAILPAKHAFGANFELVATEKPGFDPGFSLADTQKTGVISGVIENGAAHRAGLRDGMKLIAMENVHRFNNAWKADRPAVVRVEINGHERRFEYFPDGAPLKLFSFKRSSKN